MERLKRWCEWVLRRHYPLAPVLLGVLLTLPSLWVGIQADDVYIRAVVQGVDVARGGARNPWLSYTFLDGDPACTHELIEHGWLPWWTHPECRISFMRPVTTLTQMLDYRVWPAWPVLMHAQSLVWYALLVWAAGVLYRRLMGECPLAWAAALAAVLFAVDDTHGIPAGWLANRNAVLAGLFGCLTLIAHDRWRRDGWRLGAGLAPLALAVGVLAKEEAAAAGAYLLAYAVFLDRGHWARRLSTLAPYVIVGLGWQAVYKALGFGVAGSTLYVDPLSEPGLFAANVVRNGPILLLGQWGLLASDVHLLLSAPARWLHWSWAVLLMACLAVLFTPLLRRDRLARFWATGMVLSVPLACTTFPSNRLLMFTGLGAMGLLAQWLAGVTECVPWTPARRGWKRLFRVVGYVLIVIHLVAAPVLLPLNALLARLVVVRLERAFATIPADPQLEQQTLVFANSRLTLGDRVWMQRRMHDGEPVPQYCLNLSPSCSAAEIKRTDANTIAVRPVGGYLPPPGELPDQHAPLVSMRSMRYQVQYLESLGRDDRHPLRLGETIWLAPVTIEITDLTADGRPAEATFRFRAALEDASLRWIELTGDAYVPFTPPALGQTVRVPSPVE